MNILLAHGDRIEGREIILIEGKNIDMKVRCINNAGWIKCDRKFMGIKLPDKDCTGPKFGDIVTVVDSSYQEGEKYYTLLEWPPTAKDDCGWISTMFEPIQENFESVKYSEIRKEEKVSVN